MAKTIDLSANEEQAEVRPMTEAEEKEAAEMADMPDLSGIAISAEEMGDDVTAVDAETSRYVYRLDIGARTASPRL